MMKQEKLHCRLVSLVIGFGMALFQGLCLAEEAPAPPAGSDPGKVEVPALPAATPTAATTPEPKPDPAGTVTGDRYNVFNAAGDPFMISEPTDKSDADYAKKRKEVEEFQHQAATEHLTLRIANGSGMVRISYQFL